MKLTTTLNRIRACSPCEQGWEKLLSHLGLKFDRDAEINLLTILESNGVQDMLWCLRATIQDSRCISAQLAVEFAAQVLPIFESRYPSDTRPRRSIQGARDYLDGKISVDELREIRSHIVYTDTADASAYDASAASAVAVAYAASAASAYAASASAASASAASASASAFAASAASAYASAASAREKQAEIIRTLLEA